MINDLTYQDELEYEILWNLGPDEDDDDDFDDDWDDDDWDDDDDDF